MISQHLQAATLAVQVSQQYLKEGTALDAIPSVSFANAELQDFIDMRPDAREVRKALAVKLVYQGYLYDEIETILDVSRGSITGWKQAYEETGIDRLLCEQPPPTIEPFAQQIQSSKGDASRLAQFNTHLRQQPSFILDGFGNKISTNDDTIIGLTHCTK